MRKNFLPTVVAGALLLGINTGSSQGLKTVTTTMDLTMTKTEWYESYLLTALNVTGQNETQASESPDANVIGGTTVKEKISSKTILNGNKGKLYAVWTGPAPASQYPYLAAWEGASKKMAPVKLSTWAISALYIADPEDPAQTVNGEVKVKQSGTETPGYGGIIADTSNPNVPKEEKKVSGYTRFTFGLPGATSNNAIRGWGPFVADFKKLFNSTGKVRITGSSQVAQ